MVKDFLCGEYVIINIVIKILNINDVNKILVMIYGREEVNVGLGYCIVVDLRIIKSWDFIRNFCYF